MQGTFQNNGGGLRKKQKSTLRQTRLGQVDLGEEFMRALLEAGPIIEKEIRNVMNNILNIDALPVGTRLTAEKTCAKLAEMALDMILWAAYNNVTQDDPCFPHEFFNDMVAAIPRSLPLEQEDREIVVMTLSNMAHATISHCLSMLKPTPTDPKGRALTVDDLDLAISGPYRRRKGEHRLCKEEEQARGLCDVLTRCH